MEKTQRIPFRYEKLADEMEEKILSGQFKAGDKLPSLRDLHRQTRLSITTISQAYAELEIRALVEPKVKSGYYVRPLVQNLLPLPSEESSLGEPCTVNVNSLMSSLHSIIQNKSILPLGAALPATELLPRKELLKASRSVSLRYFQKDGINYGAPGGVPDLKRYLVGRTFGSPQVHKENDIIITNGCMDAIQLSLRAITKPGDIVITESPTFTCYLQLIEDLGLRTLEIPTSPKTGIDLTSVEKAIQDNSIAAMLVNPTFQNPLGFCMSDDDKRSLVELAAHNDIPIIEDDIYGDLFFSDARPSTLKSFDRSGVVLYCSSFSKTIAPDLRVGWVIAGRYLEKILQLQFNSTIAPPKFNQYLILEFLKSGKLERHLRKFRYHLENQVRNTAMAVANNFPHNSKITAPTGGHILWVEFDKSIDSMELFQKAHQAQISILPGVVCSTSKRYNHCIRLNCGNPWSEQVNQGIKTLGKILKDMSSRAT